jgi:subtilisin family serine protease
VSGTIGARNNGYGVYGVLPNVKILPIKVGAQGLE